MRRGVALGATAVETDLRLSADGEVVCVHDEHVGVRRRPVAALRADQLPSTVPTLVEVLTDPQLAPLPLSVDIKAPAVWEPLLRLARELAVGPRLWICATLAELRRVEAAGLDLGLVLSVPRERIDWRDLGPAQAVNLRYRTWDGALLERVRAGGRQALAWGLAGRPGEERRAVELGFDALYGDDVPAMVRAVQGA